MNKKKDFERIDSVISVNEIDQVRGNGLINTLLHDKKQSIPIQETNKDNESSDSDEDDYNAAVSSDDAGSESLDGRKAIKFEHMNVTSLRKNIIPNVVNHES